MGKNSLTKYRIKTDNKYARYYLVSYCSNDYAHPFEDKHFFIISTDTETQQMTYTDKIAAIEHYGDILLEKNSTRDGVKRELIQITKINHGDYGLIGQLFPTYPMNDHD